MKLAWISAAVLFMSANAFAACPAGMQGSAKFDEAVATVKRNLGQNLAAGSHAEEIATDGRPLKIDFDKSGENLKVTVWRSTDGKIFNTKQLSSTAEVCSGGGNVKLVISGYQVSIDRVSGGRLSVSVAGYGPYTFAGISGGTSVASGDGNSR